jgi:hypothetical protein
MEGDEPSRISDGVPDCHEVSMAANGGGLNTKDLDGSNQEKLSEEGFYVGA